MRDIVFIENGEWEAANMKHNSKKFLCIKKKKIVWEMYYDLYKKC